MTAPDPLDTLLAAVALSTTPVEPDSTFAAALRARVEHAMLQPLPSARENVMTSTGTPSTVVRPGEVMYTSIWTPDVTRAAAFYGAVLGWRIESGSRAESRQVTNASAPLGLQGGQRPTTFLCFAVADVDAAVVRVRAAGGSAGEPNDEPWGGVVDCVDDQGLPFALRSGPPSPAPDVTAPGALTYLTLEVPDSARARAFYGSVLGWEFSPGRVADGWGVTTDGTELRPMIGLWGGRDGDAVVTPMYVVADIDAAVAIVRSAGGASTEPERQPYGTSAECRDNQGARFYLLQY
jgi:predicted enzyme related to lactoylglutathione lyase